MSLLMQALKKAEQSRAEAGANTGSNPHEAAKQHQETPSAPELLLESDHPALAPAVPAPLEEHQFQPTRKQELTLTDFPTLALEEVQPAPVVAPGNRIEPSLEPLAFVEPEPSVVAQADPELALASTAPAELASQELSLADSPPPAPAPPVNSNTARLAAMTALGALNARNTQQAAEEEEVESGLSLDFEAPSPTPSPAAAQPRTPVTENPTTQSAAQGESPIRTASPADHAARATGANGATGATGANPDAGQAKAKALFAAKTGPQRKSQRILLLGLLGSLPLMVLGIYFYLQLATSHPNTVLNVPPVQPPAVPVTVATAPPAPPIAAPSPATASPLPGTVATVPSAAPLASPPAIASNATAAPAQPTEVASAASSQTRPPTTPRQAVRAQPNSEIQLARSNPALQLAPGLQQAYNAYQQGDDETASQLYRVVLQQDPQNRDAVLGAAAVALRQNQMERAAQLYLQLLEQDPQDPDASAALLSLQQADPQQTESRLKKLLHQHPQSASLHFMLGNVYARQQRWADAQQSFFRAFSAAPSNPDYLFNLALSLDKLQQNRLALEYYQKALLLAQASPVNFSVNAVQQRVQQLQTAPVDRN